MAAGAAAGSGSAGTGFFATGRAALAVVAFDAGVAERAAVTRRRRLAEPSTTTVTPASASALRIFLAWLGVTPAFSTARANSADVTWPPSVAACAISESVSGCSSEPVRRASVTNDLPVAWAGTAGPAGVWLVWCVITPAPRGQA